MSPSSAQWKQRLHLLYPFSGFVVVLWFVAPLFHEPLAWGSTRDWGYFTFLEEVTRKTVLAYGQFPLWNPYYFGGAEHLANPQSCVLSPTSLLTLLLGSALGIKVGIVIFALLGYFGMYQLARHWNADAAGATVSGILYGCSGFFAQHVGGGHWGFAAVSLFPCVVVCYLKGLADRRYLIAALLFSVWVAFHWGIYTLPWLFMVLLVVATNESWSGRSLRPIWILAAVTVTTFVLASVRLIPLLEYTHHFPRSVTESDRLVIGDMLRMFFSRHTARGFAGHPWEWPEYGNYLGWTAAILLLLSLAVKLHHGKMLWYGAMIFLILSLGKFGSLAPFSLLHSFPVFENLRVPSRYTALAVFFLAPLAGLTVTAITAKLRDGRIVLWFKVLHVVLPIVILLSIAGDFVEFNRRQFEQSFHLPPPTDDVSSRFQQRRGDPLRMYAYPRCNQGSVWGLEESPLPCSGALRINAEYEYLLAEDSLATVEQTWWSPNELHFRVDTPEPNLLVVNQNFRSAWTINGRGQLTDHRGLLAFALPAGTQTICLRYNPISFRIGAIISLLAVVGVLIWYTGCCRTPRDHDGGELR